MNYIKPLIRFYDRFDDLDSAQDTYSYLLHKTDWDDIFSKNKILLLAEPGYGKTRMLKEVVLESSTHKKESIFVDLKMVSNTIEDYVKEYDNKYKSAEPLDSEEKVNKCQFIKSKNFTLDNSENVIICFDALDEVQIGEKFANLINNLKEFIKKYDKCAFIISCRTHHYKRYKSILAEMAFNFCKIFQFKYEQIEAFLKRQQISEPNTKKVMENVSLANCQDILGTPRYLSMFAKLVDEKGVDNVLLLKRTDLFESFIYGKLEREASEAEIDIAIVKRVLEKLALIMEIYQSNTLTKDELLTYFDNIESNLSQAFLEVSNWQVLRDKSLIKDNIDDIQFENREFQEYLAAKELTRIAKNEQALYDLVIDAELKEVVPSWFSTLGFFIELDISKLKQFLELGKHKSDSVQDVEYHKLLTLVKTDRLDAKTKREIFDYIFNYYQKELIWIDYDVAEKLAFYCDSSFTQSLTDVFNENDPDAEPKLIKITNALRVIKYLFKHNLLLGERDILKSSLVELIKTCDESAKTEILDALKYYESFEVIESIIPYYNTNDKRTLEHLLCALSDIKPNSELTLRYLIEGTKYRSIYSRHGLYKITDANLIELMIRKLAMDESFLKEFIWLESVFDDQDSILFENIKKAINPSLLDAIEDFIIYVYEDYRHDTYDSQYVKNLFEILRTKKSNVLFSILSKIKGKKINLNRSMFDDCFRILINEEDVELFMKEIEKLDSGRQFASSMFWNYPSESEMYIKAKEFFLKEFDVFEEKRKEYSSRFSKGKAVPIDIYAKFKNKLGSRETGYYTDVFEYYLRNAEQLPLTPEDIEQFKKLVFIILNCDPLKGHIKFINKKDSGTSYTMTQNVHLFKDCLEVAKKFGWDLSGVQQNILNLIPYAYYQELEMIFECINNVANLDFKPILGAYTTRQDDLARFRPESFIRFCEKFSVISAVPILEEFIDDTKMEIQDRREALVVLTKLNPSRDKLKGLFEDWRNDPGSKQLAEKANELLIELNDKDAIEWRIAEIKNKALKVAPYEYEQTRSISEGESEFHNKRFAKPLLSLSTLEPFSQFIDLLEYSFDKVQEHSQYWDYARYIWDIECSYFSNLRIHRKYDPILNLEKYIYAKAGEKGTNWFKYRIQKLKREYSFYISKPDDILTCIQKYNRVVSNIYLFLKNHQDLINFIETTIDKDLRRFVEDEGYYREIGKVGGQKISTKVKDYLKREGYDWLVKMARGHQEDLIQKTLKVQLENAFLKNGLRNSDIIREPQLQDEKQIDFKISYGFLGPVLIEIKTTSNKEIRGKKERDTYKPKLLQYISGFNAVFGYFLIFQVSKKYPISKYKSELLELYKDCEKVGILDLTCIK